MDRRAFPQAGTASKTAAYQKQQAALAERRQRITEELITRYQTEPDRAYAREFWGEMLKERGVEL